MNKKLLKLLNEINACKGKIAGLIEEDKLEEAETEKAKLETLQNKFNMLSEILSEPETGEGMTNIAADPIKGFTNKDVVIPVSEKKDPIHDFAQAARSGFKNMNSEGTGADGGYTVPQDIQTMINQYKDAEFSLENLVTVEAVTAPSGRRTYQTRSQHTGFSTVAEGGKIGKNEGPKFEVIEYSVKKYAGALPVTNELLEDSDANITNVLVEWLGKEDVATRNKIILEAVAKKDKTTITGVDDIKKAVNVTLGQAYAGSVSVITNDDGLNYFDTLKDSTGRDLLKSAVDPSDPFKMVLAIGARKIPVIVIPNSVLKTGEAGAIPVIIGDLKEYCRIYDRKQLSIMMSDVAAVGDVNAFEQDLTIFRGLERLDCQVIDKEAIVNATLTPGE